MQRQGAHGLNERNELFSGNLWSHVLVVALGSRLQLSIAGLGPFDPDDRRKDLLACNFWLSARSLGSMSKTPYTLVPALLGTKEQLPGSLLLDFVGLALPFIIFYPSAFVSAPSLTV